MFLQSQSSMHMAIRSRSLKEHQFLSDSLGSGGELLRVTPAVPAAPGVRPDHLLENLWYRR